MAPFQTCFELYELLEHILAHLPSTDLTRAMRVSKTWKQIIEQSKTLRNARVVAALSPSFTSSNPKDWLIEGIPEYASEAGLILNSAFDAACPLISSQHSHQAAKLNLWIDYRQILESRQNEFVTYPPCQRLALEIYFGHTACSLYVKAGIRIRDVLNAWDALIRTEKLCEGESRLVYGVCEDATARLISRKLRPSMLW